MILFYIYLAVAYCVSVYGALALTDKQKHDAGKGNYFVSALFVGLIWPIVLAYTLRARAMAPQEVKDALGVKSPSREMKKRWANLRR